ncbi:MAG TPA: hypothetical protein VGK73_40660 [Polyangiaceae bacterium]
MLLLLASLLAQAIIYGALTRRKVIRSDGVGYYSYLPALVQDRDPSFRTLERREFPQGIPSWTGINGAGGRYVVKYPVGEAILLTPFFLLAWAIAALGGVASAFGWPYQAAAALSGAVYFAAGGAITWALVRERFGPKLASVALAFTVFGTNLFHYASYDAVFSHVYSFFLTATLLWLSRDLANATDWRPWCAIGFVGGLIVMTRPTNVLFAIFVAGHWLEVTGSLREGLRRLARRARYVVAAGAAALVPVAFQLAYWKAASGSWIFYSYTNEKFYFLSPKVLQVLFSVQKGTFVYMPLALIALYGAFAARRKLAGYYPALFWFGLANIWLIASWHNWAYGGSFGTRPFVEASPLFALALAGAFWSAGERLARPRWLTRLALACATYTFVLMIGYWTRTLPEAGAEPRHIANSLTLAWLRR